VTGKGLGACRNSSGQASAKLQLSHRATSGWHPKTSCQSCYYTTVLSFSLANHIEGSGSWKISACMCVASMHSTSHVLETILQLFVSDMALHYGVGSPKWLPSFPSEQLCLDIMLKCLYSRRSCSQNLFRNRSVTNQNDGSLHGRKDSHKWVQCTD
jgi:hypothetical protein